MHVAAATDRIRRAAILGDRARRTAIVVRRLTEAAVPVAALALGAALAGAALGVPRWIVPAIPAAAFVVAASAFALTRMRRPVVDRVAAELDRAANLDGAFRSACWFVDASWPVVSGDHAWREFHVTETARRVAAVDWSAVYASRTDRRSWLIACGLLAAAMVVARWPAAVPRTPVPAAATTSSAAGQTAADPSASVETPALVDAIRAIKSGRVPTSASLQAVGHALDLARSDAAAKSELDQLFSRTMADRPMGAGSGQPQDEDADGDARAQALVNPWALEWAYQDAVSRASAARPTDRDRGATSPRPDGRRPSSGDARAEPAAGRNGTDGAAVPGPARGQAAGLSPWLFGRQQADGDGGPASIPAPAAPVRSAELAVALRQEIVRASSEITDLPPSAARRAADNESASVGGRAANSTVTYDRARGGQPPVVPTDRRPLVRDVFMRPAGAGTARRE